MWDLEADLFGPAILQFSFFFVLARLLIQICYGYKGKQSMNEDILVLFGNKKNTNSRAYWVRDEDVYRTV